MKISCDKILIALSILLFVVICFTFYRKSKYENIEFDANNYDNGCSRDNRVYPEGNLPGSYLNLSDAEKNNLKRFIKNSSI